MIAKIAISGTKDVKAEPAPAAWAYAGVTNMDVLFLTGGGDRPGIMVAHPICEGTKAQDDAGSRNAPFSAWASRI